MPSPGAGPGADERVALRIMIVDDNQDAAESLRLMLELMGSEVRTVFDGQAALAAAEEMHPDVVLLDIGLPGMSGYDVCQRLRQRPWSSGTTIVALTGWGQEEDRRRSRDAGFDRHLVKPLDPDELASVLARRRG